MRLRVYYPESNRKFYISNVEDFRVFWDEKNGQMPTARYGGDKAAILDPRSVVIDTRTGETLYSVYDVVPDDHVEWVRKWVKENK